MSAVEKRNRLEVRLRELGSVIVAYSGGVDSAYLAWEAHRVLGASMLAVIANSPSLPKSQLQDALNFAQEWEIPCRVVKTHELEREAYAQNGADRCFHCKDELFDVLGRELDRLGFHALAYGLNADDGMDFRPGHKAALLHRVTAPLADVTLNKAEIRQLAADAGLRIWDKPASACLSSRIEYGRRVTPEVLAMVEEAEESLRRMGLRQFRVRHHGTIARIEMSQDEMDAHLDAASLKAMATALRNVGFRYVALDCDGYRQGSMNEILPVASLSQKKVP